MKILVISDEVWNDKINGNNVTSNWFEGMDAEFANIYASPGNPLNNCCQKYFQITDNMMFKSLFSTNRAGLTLPTTKYGKECIDEIAEKEPKALYKFLKRISGPFLRLIRELIWLFGKYNLKELKKFVKEFSPDIIFTERVATCKMLRLERIVIEYANVPVLAFTGDDEYSLKQLHFSPSFWINRLMVRKMLRKNTKLYSVYYTLSEEQKEYYEKEFKCKCKVLNKCGEFNGDYIKKDVTEPIRLIYAGKFYCNRWKMLADIVSVIKEINKVSVKMVLDIYTKDKVTNKQNYLLNDSVNSYIHNGVSQEELKEKYNHSDIAIHVESLDLRNRLATRFSFSTKIIDCIFSGCAVLAYCWEEHSGLTYLKRRDAALCATSKEELRNVLNNIVNDKTIINEYAKKAYICGTMHHNKKDVQKMLMDDMRDCVIG